MTTDRPTGPATAAPWDHPYEGSESWPDACIRCGLVGSYAHTQEFYEKWVFPAMAADAERARIFAALPAALRLVTEETPGLLSAADLENEPLNLNIRPAAAALVAAIEKSLEQNNG